MLRFASALAGSPAALPSLADGEADFLPGVGVALGRAGGQRLRGPAAPAAEPAIVPDVDRVEVVVVALDPQLSDAAGVRARDAVALADLLDLELRDLDP